MPASNRLLLPFAAALLLTSAARSQAPPPAISLTYDVVSIKPNKSGSGNINWRGTSDGFVAGNITLKMLLVDAYSIREGLISGLPAWAESAHFDINAKVLDVDPKILKSRTDEQGRAMIATLLADRFGLKVHTETKTLPVYNLIIARRGPRFRENPAKPYTPDPSNPNSKPPAGLSPGNAMWNNGELTAVAVPLTVLTRSLEGDLDRNIVDLTGLSGRYDLHLKYTPERQGALSSDSDVPPPLFTALEEQLGLKLQPGRGPVLTLVVDHISPPTEN